MLAESREPQRVGELASVMVRDATTITRQLDSLVKQGLVVRTASPNDRRVVLVEITPEGHNVHHQLAPVLNAIRQRLLTGIDEHRLTETVAIIKKMQANLHAVK